MCYKRLLDEHSPTFAILLPYFTIIQKQQKKGSLKRVDTFVFLKRLLINAEIVNFDQ